MMFTRTANFLEEIGIQVRVEENARGFLAHMRIERSAIIVDGPKSSLCGDMLHEAGHIAVIPSLFRSQITANISAVQKLMGNWFDENPNAMGYPENPIGRAILQSGECEAIAWSFAAANELGFDTMLPFSNGFDGKGREVHGMLEAGAHFGVNGLVAAGMTEQPRYGRTFPFPKMKRWMQI